jgi:hypothetical protein
MKESGFIPGRFSAVRFADCASTCGPPSAKALGYSHTVRFADAANRLCSKAVAGFFSFADRTRIIASVRPDILAHAQTNQLLSHLIKALLLTVIDWGVHVVTMKYSDRNNRLFSRAARTWTDMPGSVEGPDFETAGPFLCWCDPVGDFR